MKDFKEDRSLLEVREWKDKCRQEDEGIFIHQQRPGRNQQRPAGVHPAAKQGVPYQRYIQHVLEKAVQDS